VKIILQKHAIPAVMAGIVFFTLLWVSTIVGAHEWYDFDCCDTRDCYPLPDDAILIELPEGAWHAEWISPLDGKPIKGVVAPQNVRNSQDRKVHGCQTSYGQPRCLYIHRGV
jgi:hypothetical protein